jgi:hypothetical protein
MKIKAKELFENRESYLRLAGVVLDIVTAFRIRKFIKAVAEEITEIGEARNKLIKKYGVKKDDKWNVPEDSDGYANFVKEQDDLYAQEIELPDIKVKLTDLQMVVVGSDGKPTEKRNVLTNYDIAILENIIEE